MAFRRRCQHFVDCVLHDRQPLVTGADGKAVLEILFAAYESARLGPQNPAAVFDESGQALRSVAEELGATESRTRAWPQSITAAIMRR